LRSAAYSPAAWPLAGVCVHATAAPGSVLTVSQPDGRYVLAGLRPGRYLLHFVDCAQPGRYLDQWSGGVPTPGQAEAWQVRADQAATMGVGPGQAVTATAGSGRAATVAVGAGQVRTLAPVTLQPANPAAVPVPGTSSRPAAPADLAGTGRISGLVTGKSRPLRHICVQAYPLRGSTVLGAETSSHGSYTIRGLRPGRYQVEFADSGCRSTGNWLTQWYRGLTTPYQPPQATTIRVPAGQAVRGIDASLTLGGEITGTVTSRPGKSLGGICVEVDPTGDGGYGASYSTQSGRTGRYVVHGVFPGRYLAQFMIGCGNNGNYAPQWWPHAATFRRARSIKISGARVVRHVDAAMGPGAVVSGVVRFRNSSGQRLSGICVIEQEQYGIAYFSQGRTVTDRKGAYRLYALGTGSYTLMFDPGCGNNGNYLDAQRSFSIRAGQTRSGFDVFLQPGAGISGLVTDTRGRPVVGICVQIQDSQGDFGYAQTRRDGSYSIGGMTAGSYTVQFTGGCGNRPSYAPQYYNGATTSDSADAVRLTVGTVITGIDVTMQPGGTITGVVTDGRGHRLSHVCVGSVAPAQTPDGGYSDIEYTRDGSYQARNLAPGLYLVGFGCTNGYLAGQWFKSTQTVGGADLVSVNPGVITAGINAVMRPGGFISGMVTNRAGQRLANMCVLAFQRSSGLIAGYTGSIPYTDNGGRYRIGQLAQGRYDIEFFDCYNSVYGSQWYARRATQRAATGVWVRSGRITTGIGAALAVGGSISGRVVDNLGRPVGVCVTASDVATNSYAFSWSGANGYYTITGLSSGKYSVEFSACGTGEPNVGSVTSPGLVRVVAPHATRGINVRLPVGGSISGTVLGGSPTPKPQADVCVEVVPASQGGAYQYLMTTRDGAYLAANLAPGKYQVYVGDPYCPDASADFAPQWYDHQPSQSTATTVTVTAGRVTGGIGVTLLPYGGISGVVTGPSNAPVGGECVTAVPIDAVSGLLFGAVPQPEIALTGRDGSYALMSMLPGRYKVKFSGGCGASGLATQWWHGASSERAATVITVTANAVRTGIDAALRR